MGYRLRGQGGQDRPYVNEYIVDKESDKDLINKAECDPGSTVLVLENSEVYMLNTDRTEWKPL